MTDAKRHIEAALRYCIAGEAHARIYYTNLAGDFSAIANELSAALRAQEGMVLVPREVKTLIEDFHNPCFGGKLHNDIPRQIGLAMIAAAQSTEQNAGEAESKRVSDAPIKHRGEVSASPAPDKLVEQLRVIAGGHRRLRFYAADRIESDAAEKEELKECVWRLELLEGTLSRRIAELQTEVETHKAASDYWRAGRQTGTEAK